jgi:cyclic beta-1,2-glucan synthetase
MAALQERLIAPVDGLALLFTPPFDHTSLDPGYVKGYPPGIRENGGQYTHAAAWAVMAFAGLGQAEAAVRLFSMLNPINHSRTQTALQRYRVEPYVVAADIYSVAPHSGRGGWTWYTGSAAWLYRAGLESILGLRLHAGRRLTIDPCIPAHWPGFEVLFNHGSTRYQIQVLNTAAPDGRETSSTLDGEPLPAGITVIDLADDGAAHEVHIRLGTPTAAESLPRSA